MVNTCAGYLHRGPGTLSVDVVGCNIRAVQDLLCVPLLLLGYKQVKWGYPYVHIVIASVCDKYFGAPALEFLMPLQVRESETT